MFTRAKEKEKAKSKKDIDSGEEEKEKEEPLKWDIELEYENEGINLDSDMKKTPEKFESIFNRLDTLNNELFLNRKNSFNFTKKLSMGSKKQSLKRIKTAITIKSFEKSNVEVSDENGKVFKIDKNLLNKIDMKKRISSKITFIIFFYKN